MLNQAIKECQEWYKETYLQSCNIPISVNGRLKRVVGRFLCTYRKVNGKIISKSNCRIELSKNAFNDYKELINTIKHEMTHYYCFINDLPFRDSDNYFKVLCIKNNVPLSSDLKIEHHYYSCDCGCGFRYTLRKINSNKYICKKCGGKLSYKGIKVV